jgi:hypothetical protein
VAGIGRVEGGCGPEVADGWGACKSAISLFGGSLAPSSFLQKFMAHFALEGRVLNPAAEGEAAPSQREKHDWGARRGRGMADVAKEKVHIVPGCSDWRHATELTQNGKPETQPKRRRRSRRMTGH